MKVGDTFIVPLAASSVAPGHIVAREAEALNSVTCAFYDQRLRNPTTRDVSSCLTADRLIACLFTTRDLLDRGSWRILGHESPNIPKNLLPNEHTRRKGWVGAKIIGSGNVEEFLNAFHCLVPWDHWADPLYLDRLLIHPSKKPPNVILTRNA